MDFTEYILKSEILTCTIMKGYALCISVTLQQKFKCQSKWGSKCQSKFDTYEWELIGIKEWELLKQTIKSQQPASYHWLLNYIIAYFVTFYLWFTKYINFIFDWLTEIIIAFWIYSKPEYSKSYFILKYSSA